MEPSIWIKLEQTVHTFTNKKFKRYTSVSYEEIKLEQYGHHWILDEILQLTHFVLDLWSIWGFLHLIIIAEMYKHFLPSRSVSKAYVEWVNP